MSMFVVKCNIKTVGIVSLLVSACNIPTSPGRQPQTPAVRPSVQCKLNEVLLDTTFRDLENGDIPREYGGLRVFEEFGTKVLAAQAQGIYSFQINKDFPDDFRLTLTLGGDSGNSKNWCFQIVLKGTNDPLPYFACPHPVGGGHWEVGFLGTRQQGDVDLSNAQPTDIGLDKRGDTYKILVNNSVIVASQFPGPNQFGALQLRFQTDGFRDATSKGHFVGGIKLECR